MRYLFLNQYIPPDSSPTARLLGDISRELTKRGHEVIWVGSESNYLGKKTILGSRMLRELIDLGCLLLKGSCVRSKCDVIFFLTSPPLLPVIARLLCARHRKARLVHWVMDLYPEIAVALNELKGGSGLERLSSWLMALVYKRCDTVIALDRDMSFRLKRYGIEPRVARPWPALLQFENVAWETVKEKDVNQHHAWLYSGNLGKAHEWRTLLDAQSLIEESGDTISLVFQGSGPAQKEAKRYAEEIGLKRCEWRGYAPANEVLRSLLGSDALIVTQKPETKGCLWPSKLALARLIDRPLIWVGPVDSNITEALKIEGTPCFAPDEAMALANHVNEVIGNCKGDLNNEIDKVVSRVNQERENGISRITDILEDSR